MASVLSSHKVNPLSLASAIRRTASHNEVQAKLAQFESRLLQVRHVAAETGIVQQAEQAELKTLSVFPYVSTLAMMQFVAMRPVSTSRLFEYEAMAANMTQDDEVGLGKIFDMRA